MDNKKKRIYSSCLRLFLAILFSFSLLFTQCGFIYAATFTAGVAKRDGSGPFAGASMLQGGWAHGDPSDTLTHTQGSSIGTNFYDYNDRDQGSISFWITPEWGGNDDKTHIIWVDGGGYQRTIYKQGTNNRLYLSVTPYSVSVDVSSWTAGTTYHIVGRWDIKNTLDGTNYLSLSINDSHTFGVTTAPTAGAPTGTSYIGAGYPGVTPANALIEGLTIYRRPLYDGDDDDGGGVNCCGIDVGNGDEIAKIYDSDENNGNGITPQDPTLVTGSWDVVFAIPTDSTTGAMTTGTYSGQAWTHPHSSNLLPGNSNTGGFMLDGDPSDDGWLPLSGVVPLSTNGDALSFDGGDLVTITNNSGLDITGPVTVEAWVYPTISGNDMGFFTAVPQYILWVQSNNEVRFADDQGHYIDSAADVLTLNTWNHVVGVFSGTSSDTITLSNAKIYVNGESVGDHVSGDWSPGTYSAARIGMCDSPWYMTGQIDDVRVWNDARTQQEIQDNMYKELSGSEDNLVGYWKLNDGSGQTVTDSTSNGNDGTLGVDSGSSTDDPTWVTTAPLPPEALATSEKIFAGGYKYTSNAANQGIYDEISVTNGDDFVVRAIAHSDGTCVPKVLITGADDGEITHLDGTTGSDRDAPDVLLFTFEADATENIKVKLINTAASGICSWHQVEVLENLIDNPSMERVTGTPDPWIPDGWTNLASNLTSGESAQETSDCRSGSSCIKFVDNQADHNDGIRQSPSLSTGEFYSIGFWSKGNGSRRIRDRGHGTLYYFQHGNNYEPGGAGSGLEGETTTSWHVSFGVRRSAGGSDTTIECLGSLTGGGDLYADDPYNIALNATSLTVTPADLGNSTENTDEIRVDGRDTYIETTASSLGTTSGYASFDYRPRHSAAAACLFAEDTNDDAYILSLTDSDNSDYLNLFWDSANNVKLAVDTGSGESTDVWDATGIISADSQYAVLIQYTDGGNITVDFDGTERLSIAMADAFDEAPDDAYFGSDYSGANQGDATFSNIVFDNNAPVVTLTPISPDPTSNTPPYLTGSVTDTSGTISTVEFQVDSTAGSWTSCAADDSSFDEATESFTCSVSSVTGQLGGGEHTIYVRSTDSASNTSSPVSDTFTINPVVSGSSAPSCTDIDSSSKPIITSALGSISSIMITFLTPGDNSDFDRYAIEYGTAEGDYQYAQDNIAGSDDTKYQINFLNPSTTYYIRIRTANGCAGGIWSEPISGTTTSQPSFFDITRLETEIVTVDTKPKDIECGIYTVEPGDSLWSITRNISDELYEYEDIITLNKDKYPSLIDNPEYIVVGWELNIPCEKDEKEEEEQLEGYTVKVKVVDTDTNPVENVKVVLYSEPKEAYTNENGEAVFEDIEKGEHRIVIDYKGQSGEQNVNLKGDVEVYDFTIQIQRTNPLTSPLVLTLISILVLMNAFLFTWIYRLKKKS